MGLVPSGVQLSTEEAALIEAAGSFARNELLSLDRGWDRDESSIAGILPRLEEMGLLALSLPEEIAGLGCRYPIYTAILHEVAVWSASAAVTIAVHNMVGRILSRSLKEPLRTDVLRHFGRADHFSAFALSEAGAGSDSAGVTTTVANVGGGYEVNGEKMWITNGISARWFLVLARFQADAAPSRENLCALLVDGSGPGIERTKISGKMGIRGSETAVVHFAKAYAPDTHLIARPGEGLRVFLSSLNEGRLGIAAQATGIAEACLREMVTYAQHREQFGRTIGKFQAIADMIATSAMELETAKLLVWHAACCVAEGRATRAACSQAKLYATECANRIAYRAVQVHGGTGYVHECRVEQLFRDARVTTIYEGTSEVQRMVIASELRRNFAPH